jgi:hypothetical protein
LRQDCFDSTETTFGILTLISHACPHPAKAVAEKSGYIQNIRTWREFDNLRSDPRFKAILVNMELSQ